MLRKLAIGAALQLILASAAYAACDGQAGNTIFEDNFQDDSGGWDNGNALWKVQSPNFVATLPAQNTQNLTLNQTFNATDGDYCVDVKLPSPSPDNVVAGGLVVLAGDYKNYFLGLVRNNGSWGVYRQSAGQWATIAEGQDAQTIKTDTNTTNSLRITVKDGKITYFVNGKQMKVVRAQIANTPLRFGLYTDLSKDHKDEIDIQFANYKVTSGS
jgi:hypothetical protein